jgi:endonuclease III
MIPEPVRNTLLTLARKYGKPAVEEPADPFEMILRENIGYLVTDEQREEAFRALRERIGTAPGRILAAPRGALHEVAALGGMHPEDRVATLIRIAEIAVAEAEGDLRKVLAGPLPRAREVLRKFPGIKDPIVEKILLFTRTHPSLVLESNGLRVLLRLGFGEEKKGYDATLQAVQDAVGDQLGDDYSLLMEAHILLRRHGRETCRRSPACGECPLTSVCRDYQRRMEH